MALNTVNADEYSINDVINYNIEELIEKINKEGFSINEDDFEYDFLDRCEKLTVESDRLYPNEDLPRLFGVHRGYAGGGMHSGLEQTEIYRLPKRRQAKAQRILNLFEKYFKKILKELNDLDSENTEIWNSVEI